MPPKSLREFDVPLSGLTESDFAEKGYFFMEAIITMNKKKIKVLFLILSIISMLIVSCQQPNENSDNSETSTTPLLPSSIVFKSIPGGTFTMGDNSINSARKNITATEHEVTLSNFEMSETEVTTAQFAEFLSNAYKDGLIEINETRKTIEVVGSSSSEYAGKGLYELSGTRVMKDHDNADGDAQGMGDGDGAFTGTVEPENPLNIAFIGFDESRENPFYVKDPHTDFDWHEVCNYYDYTSTPKQLDTSELKNDYSNWSELQNLPTLEDVSNYPVAYIRWWGAKAFTLYYDIKLPTEAQWEYAAKGGQNFFYAVHDGIDVSNANWNEEQAKPATHHRHNVKEGIPNPYGLYNLGGNVWEWEEDNYEPFDMTPATNPIILDGSDERCKRGGAWNYHQTPLGTAARDYTFDNRGNDHHCFRIARYSVTDADADDGQTTDATNVETNDVDNQTSDVSAIEFVDVPGDGKNVEPFTLAKTEITNQQYVDFLNAALCENMITVGPATGATNLLIYDKNGNQMMNILGYRVIKDHDRDGVFKLWEMENPLNRCMIEYDSEQKMFSVVNPSDVNWEIYFDKAVYPNVVDKITDWCEFHEFWPAGVELDGKEIITFSKDIYNADGSVKDNITFAGHLDLDCELPSFEEVQRWPVNHVQYYGAKAFVDFYGYELPSLQELQWTGKGGNEDWVYATNDGTINSGNVVYNGGNDRSDGKHKGHPQPVATFAPNPYGVYDLSGNVAEWSRTVDTGHFGCRLNPNTSEDESVDSMVRIDGAWPRPDIMCKISDCINTDVTRGNDHFGFRVVK